MKYRTNLFSLAVQAGNELEESGRQLPVLCNLFAWKGASEGSVFHLCKQVRIF